MISIITPTFNSAEYLEDCIISIINQNFDDYEHIIIDGLSTDNTLQIIKKYENRYRMRWVSEKDRGMYDAIKKGFEMAEGDIFCWLNSDDMYMPWTLKLVAKIMQNTKIQWCTGIPSEFSNDGINYCICRKTPAFPQKLIGKGWMDGRRLGCIQQESTFWRKELYVKSGGLNPDYQYAGDYHLWKSFAGYEKLYVVNSILAGFRKHSGQKSEDQSLYYGEIGDISKIQMFYARLKLYSIRRLVADKRMKNEMLRVEEIVN